MGHPDPQLSIETISPDTAKQLLAVPGMNRKVRPDKVEQYARAMRGNRWELNGTPIRIDTTGFPIDGQHRLLACIKAEMPFRTVVVRGLNPAFRKTIDTGLKRTLGDELKMRKEHHYSSLAAALSWLWRYQSGNMTKDNASTTPSTEEGLALLDASPSLRESVAKTRTVAYVASCGLCAFVHFMAAQRDPILADRFMEILSTGLGCEADDPAYRLRQRLISNRAGKAKLRGPDVAALIIKAWNATVTGARPRILKQATRGENREPFPEFA